MGGTDPHGSWAAGISRNIERLIAERGTSKHAVQQASVLSRSTFYRKMDKKPEHFTVEELGSIAETLGVQLSDILRPHAA